MSSAGPETERRVRSGDTEYRLLRLLGEGATARVYLAQRDDPELPLPVALKILRRRRGADARLERERRLLSRLDHAHVARLLGSGTTDDGQGFLVLEYVRGRPIDVYCREEDLDLDGRLALLLDVCAAVDHGHRALVLHQDLKPSNVLVTDDGAVKVLDFGIGGLFNPADDHDAEDRDADDPDEAVAGAFSEGFASPEQVAGRPLTTATDVYSLGALLHLLVVGRVPHDVAGRSRAALQERLERQDPTPPGRLLEQVDRDAHGADLPKDLRPARARLPRDLAAILQKALDRDIDRRYATVAEAAEDLRRFRAGLPVAAQPPSAAYRLRKWLDRHRRVAWRAGAAALLLLLMGAVLWYTAGRLTEERDQAETQSAQAALTLSFLEDTLGQAHDGGGEPKTVQALLQDAASRLVAETPDGTADNARLFWILGRAIHSFGDPEHAVALFDRALQALDADPGMEKEDAAQDPLGQEGLGQDPMLEAIVHLDLVSAQIDLDRYGEAERHLELGRRLTGSAGHGRNVHSRQTQRHGGEDLLAEQMRLMADSFEGSLLYRRGDVEGADRILSRVMPQLSAIWRPGDHQRLETERLWALAQMDLGRYERAIPVYRAHLSYFSTWDAPPIRRLQSLHHLGSAQFLVGHFEAAAVALEQALQTLDQVGENTLSAGPLTAMAALNLIELGRLDEAEALARRSLDIRRRLFGDENRHVGFAWNVLARVAAAQGRPGDAETAFLRARDHLESSLPSDHPFQSAPLSGLGNLWVDLDRAADAEPLLRRAAELRHGRFGPDNHETAQSRLDLSVCLRRLGREPEAEAAWRDGARVLLPTARRDLALRRVCGLRPDAELCRRFD